MFSLVYFSVEVCLVGVFPQFVNTRRDLCARVCAPLTLASPLKRKQNRTGGDPALHLRQVRGHVNWRMGLPALLGGNLGCHCLGLGHEILVCVVCFYTLLWAYLSIFSKMSVILKITLCILIYLKDSDTTESISIECVVLFHYDNDWFRLDLFNDDTRPSGHISRPTQVNVSQELLSFPKKPSYTGKCVSKLLSLSKQLLKSDHIVHVCGLVEVNKLHHSR